MRIALITREYPPETSWGGIGTFYVTFARALKEAGCDVEVFTQALSHPSREDHEGILVHRVVPRNTASAVWSTCDANSRLSADDITAGPLTTIAS